MRWERNGIANSTIPINPATRPLPKMVVPRLALTTLLISSIEPNAKANPASSGEK
ncbi:hypothetical protein D3C78_1134060 [compost metagenome]